MELGLCIRTENFIKMLGTIEKIKLKKAEKNEMFLKVSHKEKKSIEILADNTSKLITIQYGVVHMLQLEMRETEKLSCNYSY